MTTAQWVIGAMLFALGYAWEQQHSEDRHTAAEPDEYRLEPGSVGRLYPGVELVVLPTDTARPS